MLNSCQTEIKIFIRLTPDCGQLDECGVECDGKPNVNETKVFVKSQFETFWALKEKG